MKSIVRSTFKSMPIKKKSMGMGSKKPLVPSHTGAGHAFDLVVTAAIR